MYQASVVKIPTVKFQCLVPPRNDISVHLPAQVAAVAGEAETPIVYCDLPEFASLLPGDLYVASGV